MFDASLLYLGWSIYLTMVLFGAAAIVVSVFIAIMAVCFDFDDVLDLNDD